MSMNLQEQIRRMQELMGLDESTSNYKPSVEFDREFGTNTSQKWEYPFGLSEEQTHKILINCLHNDDENDCREVVKIVNALSEFFPYENYNQLNINSKIDILHGMVSNFNYDDIVWFSVYGKSYKVSIKDKTYKKELGDIEKKLKYPLQWVPSPDTINKIKEQLSL